MADHGKAVDELRRLLEDEKGLYVGNPVDERLLQLYLRFANYNAEKAFEKMKTVFKLKVENKEFYAYRRDPDLHDVILKKGIHMLLDERDQLGRRLYLVKLGNMVYGAHEPYEMFQVDDLWLSLAIDEEETQKNGLMIIFDMGGMSWKFLRYFTPHIIRSSSLKAENIPLRHIQFHVVNAGLLLNTVVQLVFPFLSPATKEAIFFHKSKETLHTHISRSSLPVEYGGERPSPQPELLVKNFLDPKQQRLTELLSYGYNTETKENEK